jgi:hypothetical protein
MLCSAADNVVEVESISATEVHIALSSHHFSSGMMSTPLLMLIHSSLLDQSVRTGMQIDSDMYGVIDIMHTDPAETPIVTPDTLFSFYKTTSSPCAAFNKILLSEQAHTATTELSELIIARLQGIDSSIHSICDPVMDKLRRVVGCEDPSAVSAGVLIKGYGGAGKSTVLDILESYFKTKGASVSYLNCALLLSERKRLLFDIITLCHTQVIVHTIVVTDCML